MTAPGCVLGRPGPQLAPIALAKELRALVTLVARGHR